MRVAIIIVNYRTAELVAECLRSLAEQVEASAARVVVVDNGSGDGSAEQLRAVIERHSWQPWVTLLPLTTNRGYAAGNNQALRLLLERADPPEYFWLLNPDCSVQPGALAALLDFMGRHTDAAIAGSQLLNRDGEVERSAFRFHTLLGELDDAVRWRVVSRLVERYVVAPMPSVTACPTDWVAGASMIVRRAVFERIGMLDEDYFLYFEDVDFCLRAQRAGLCCWYVPHSRVVHLSGSSTGVTDPARATARRPAYWFRSRQRYFRKHFGAVYTLAADAVFAAGFLTWRVRRAIQRKPDRDPAHFLWDFVRHSARGLAARRFIRNVRS